MVTTMLDRGRWRLVTVGTVVALALSGAALGVGTTAALRSGGETVVQKAPAAESVQAPGLGADEPASTSPERCLESRIDDC